MRMATYEWTTSGEEDGQDKIFGQGEADRIYGGGGFDLLDGGAGSDDVRGGEGGDTLIFHHWIRFPGWRLGRRRLFRQSFRRQHV